MVRRAEITPILKRNWFKRKEETMEQKRNITLSNLMAKSRVTQRDPEWNSEDRVHSEFYDSSNQQPKLVSFLE
ncbi:hypothetical protein BGZ65_009819, partial [Modicella reniformis]